MTLGLVELVRRIPFLAAIPVTCILGWHAGLLLLVSSTLLFGWKTVWLVLRTLPRDVIAFKRYAQLMIFLRIAEFREKTPVVFFTEVAKKYAKKPMFHYGDTIWTFEEANLYTNRIANFFKQLDLKPGDDVTLVMENCPEMVLMYFGLAKIGVASALVNTNLRKSPLLHSISSVKAKAVIYTPTTAPALMELSEELKSSSKSGVRMLCYGAHEGMAELGATDIKSSISEASTTAPTFRGKNSDRFLYVFTSGTTGLPKAAIIKNYRFLLCGCVGKYLARVETEDVVYLHLPFYHTVGGIMGMSLVVMFGSTGVVVPKFSASKFWSDCIRYKCTVTQYIGEICRYLYMQPPKPEDKTHSIRMMFGNGMKPSLWSKFVKRFNIDDIKELYGSSEGNANIMNMDKAVGKIGCIPTVCRLSRTMARRFWNRFLIKVDPETGKPLRGPDGLCILCGPNEPGEWVGAINNKRPECAFDGYTNNASSPKKMYTDVVVKGDRCFGTGDILEYDELGYLSFKDRTGDTFRWKGENVSTAEVENVVNKYLIMNDCVVYGVHIPGAEGKAGMMALLDPDREYAKGENLSRLLDKISAELPAYAVPVIIRLATELEATSTFKLPKTKLSNEGYDLAVVKDPLFILDKAKQQYVVLDGNIIDQMREGAWRL